MQRVGGWCEPIRFSGCFPFSESAGVMSIGGGALYSAETVNVSREAFIKTQYGWYRGAFRPL